MFYFGSRQRSPGRSEWKMKLKSQRKMIILEHFMGRFLGNEFTIKILIKSAEFLFFNESIQMLLPKVTASNEISSFNPIHSVFKRKGARIPVIQGKISWQQVHHQEPAQFHRELIF